MEIRPAEPEDIPDLAQLLIIGAQGLIDAIYHDLIPGLPINKIVEKRFHYVGTAASYENCWVAEQEGRVIGKIHAFPADELGSDLVDPLVPEERYVLLEPFETLYTPGSYYIDVVAVYPEFRGQGVGSRLMSFAASQAKAGGFKELNLVVTEQNIRAVQLYQRIGFKIANRSPIVEHELIHYSGDWVLMTCPV